MVRKQNDDNLKVGGSDISVVANGDESKDLGWLIRYGQTEVVAPRDQVEDMCNRLQQDFSVFPAISPPGCQKNAISTVEITKQIDEKTRIQFLTRPMGKGYIGLVQEIQKLDEEKLVYTTQKGNAALGKWSMEGNGTKKEPYRFLSECITTDPTLKKVWKDVNAAVKRLYETYLVSIHHMQLRPAIYRLFDQLGGFKVIGGGGMYFIPKKSEHALDQLMEFVKWVDQFKLNPSKKIVIRKIPVVANEENDLLDMVVEDFNEAGTRALDELIGEIQKEVTDKRKAGKSIGGRRFETFARKAKELKAWATGYESLLETNFADIDAKRQILATVMTAAGGML